MIKRQDLDDVWETTFPTMLALNRNEIPALLFALGFDEQALHEFTNERGAKMCEAGKRNGLSGETSHAAAVLHGIILGTMIGKTITTAVI